MKKFFVIATMLLLAGTIANAQLKDSKWRGNLNIPNSAECIMEFKKDTVYVYVAANNELLETMSYSIAKDTLYLQKLSGQSPCQGETKGTYKIALKDDKLNITPLADDCQERSMAFTPEAWIREKS